MENIQAMLHRFWKKTDTHGYLCCVGDAVGWRKFFQTVSKKGIMAQKQWKVLLLGIGALSLSGCTFIGMGYNNLDRLIRWEVDDYFNLTDEQEDWLNEQLAQHLEWHRSTELPQYVAFLRRVQEDGQDGLTSAEWRTGLADVEAGRDRLFDRLRPDAAALLARLEPEQIDYLKERIAEDNEEWEDRLKEPREDRREERREETLTTLEDWFGDGSTAQREAFGDVYDQTSAPEDQTLIRMERRKQTQDSFLRLLEGRPSVAEAEAWLREWQAGWTNPVPNNWKGGRYEQRVLAIDALLKPEQRQHAAVKLEEYAVELEQLLPASGPETAQAR